MDTRHQTERVLTRGIRIEQERAIGGARNPSDSKYGCALYKINHDLYKVNSASNRRHSSQMETIEKELRRSNLHMDHERRQFLRQRSAIRPMLIVDRPPSPIMVSKHKAQQYTDDEYHSYSSPERGPRYMKPLQSKLKSTTLRPTIDAFCVSTKKKVNLWEAALLEREKPTFKSTVMPSWPLSSSEVDDLVHGLERHEAQPQSAKSLVVFDQGKARKSGKKKKGKKKISPKQLEWVERQVDGEKTDQSQEREGDGDVGESSWHFVTEARVKTLVSEQDSDDEDAKAEAVPDLEPEHIGLGVDGEEDKTTNDKIKKLRDRDSDSSDKLCGRKGTPTQRIPAQDISQRKSPERKHRKSPSKGYGDKGTGKPSNENREPKRLSSENGHGVPEGTHPKSTKQVSGLEIILEAAIEGLT